MKKLLFVVASFSFAFVSCKKDYSCTCTTTLNGIQGAPVIYNYNNVSKTTAKAKCYENSKTTSGPAFNKTTNCTFN